MALDEVLLPPVDLARKYVIDLHLKLELAPVADHGVQRLHRDVAPGEHRGDLERAAILRPREVL